MPIFSGEPSSPAAVANARLCDRATLGPTPNPPPLFAVVECARKIPAVVPEETAFASRVLAPIVPELRRERYRVPARVADNVRILNLWLQCRDRNKYGESREDKLLRLSRRCELALTSSAMSTRVWSEVQSMHFANSSSGSLKIIFEILFFSCCCPRDQEASENSRLRGFQRQVVYATVGTTPSQAQAAANSRWSGASSDNYDVRPAL